MAKRFKLKISRVIPSFQTCRSKDPTDLPENPVPSFFRLSPVNTKLIDVVHVQPSKPRRSFTLKRHVPSAIISVGCGFRSKSVARQISDDDYHTQSLEYSWQREEKWHVVAKIYDENPRRKIYNSSASGGSDDDKLPPPIPQPSTAAEKKKRRSKKKKTTTSRIRLSTSSADSGRFSFSSEGRDERDEEEETETLVSSSRSFSTDLETIRESSSGVVRKKRNKKKKKVKRCVIGELSSAGGSGTSSPARLSMFQKLIPCTVEGKVRESFAVVKKSEDPYEDFKRSMMEMILEKEMFEEKDLEQLLHCFLSLNSRDHHGVIVEAFTEIWEALFCNNNPSLKNHLVLKQRRKSKKNHLVLKQRRKSK